MTLAYLTGAARARYAAAASFERDERERLYPPRVAEGKLTEEFAQTDWQAWVAIARWCAGERIGFELADEHGPDAPRASNLALMEQAAALALQSAETALARRPADAAALKRRDNLAAIHSLLNKNRIFTDEFNANTRRLAAQRVEAA